MAATGSNVDPRTERVVGSRSGETCKGVSGEKDGHDPASFSRSVVQEDEFGLHWASVCIELGPME